MCQIWLLTSNSVLLFQRIIRLSFCQNATSPLPVFHFETRLRSSTDGPVHTVQNQAESDLVLADCVMFWPSGSDPEQMCLFTGQWDEDGVVISRAGSVTTCSWLSVEKATWMLTSAGTNTKNKPTKTVTYPSALGKDFSIQMLPIPQLLSQILGTNKRIAPGLNKGIKTVLIWSLCSSDGNTVSWHRL